MTISTYLTALLAALTMFSPVAALPKAVRTVYPEVIPGPGMPSLASLNLTSEQLYNMPLTQEATDFVERSTLFTPGCGPADEAYTDVADIICKFCPPAETRQVHHYCRKKY